MHQRHALGSIAVVAAPPVVDLPPSGLWCGGPTPTQGCAALRPGLKYPSPYGLQSPHPQMQHRRRSTHAHGVALILSPAPEGMESHLR